MKRTTYLWLCGIGLLAFMSPMALRAQDGGGGGGAGGAGGGGNTGGATTGGATSGGATSGATSTGTTTTGGGGTGGTVSQGAPAQGVTQVTSATIKANVYAASSGAGSATTIPSNTNFMGSTYVIPQSLGLPSLYQTQFGAQNVITQTGGPKGKFSFLYVPVPSTAVTNTTTTTTAPGFSTQTQKFPRAPVYSTVLSDDLPLVRHDPSQLNATVRATLDRSSMIRNRNGIQVQVDGNLVMLTGTVGTEKELRIAEGLVRMTPGVHQVRNELIIVNAKN